MGGGFVRRAVIVCAAAVLGLGTLLGGMALAEGTGSGSDAGTGGGTEIGGGTEVGGDTAETTPPNDTAPDSGGSDGGSGGGGTGTGEEEEETVGTTPPNGDGTSAPALQAITVTPGNTTLAPGMAKQYTATGNYADGSTQDITDSVMWTTGTLEVATAGAGGVVTAVAPGTSTIAASVGSTTGSATVRVSQLRSIKVVPVNSAVSTGGTKAFMANGKFANNVTENITGQVVWTSGNDAVATVMPQGVVTGMSPGTAQINAAFGMGVAGTASVRVK